MLLLCYLYLSLTFRTCVERPFLRPWQYYGATEIVFLLLLLLLSPSHCHITGKEGGCAGNRNLKISTAPTEAKSWKRKCEKLLFSLFREWPADSNRLGFGEFVVCTRYFNQICRNTGWSLFQRGGTAMAMERWQILVVR